MIWYEQEDIFGVNKMVNKMSRLGRPSIYNDAALNLLFGHVKEVVFDTYVHGLAFYNRVKLIRTDKDGYPVTRKRNGKYVVYLEKLTKEGFYEKK